jgi:hypothetical protein
VTWLNRLRADQINGVLPPDTTASLADSDATNYSAAITPKSTSDFAWEGNEYVAYVAAIAPTNNDPASTNDKLFLKQIDLQFVKSAGSPVDYSISFTTTEKPNGQEFLFKQAVGVFGTKSLDPLTGEMVENKISVMRNAIQPVYLDMQRHAENEHFTNKLPANGSIQYSTQLYNCSYDYEFLFDKDGGGVYQKNATTGDLILNDDGEPLLETTVTSEKGTKADLSKSGRDFSLTKTGKDCVLTDAINNKTLQGDSTPDDVTANIFTYPKDTHSVGTPVPNDMRLATHIKYAVDGKIVEYFSPIQNDNTILNQGASVTGDIKIDSEAFAKSNTSRAIGEKTGSKRPVFYEALVKLLGGKRLTDAKYQNNLPVTIGSGTWTDQGNHFVQATDGSAYYYRSKKSDTEPCKIMFDNTVSNIAFANDFTMVSEGCDIYIDQNIFAPAGSANKGKLGIIAFENLSMGGTRKGGNVYICNRVTDIQANIVADGSLLTYGSDTECKKSDDSALGTSSIGISAVTGLPINTNPQYAKNQLTIQGSVMSKNTLGGAFQSPPLKGDGTRVTDANEAELKEVRMTDLNFLRYAKHSMLIPNTPPAIGNKECWADGIGLSQSITSSGSVGANNDCDNNNPRDQGIVNIFYRDPSPQMPLFNAVVKKK